MSNYCLSPGVILGDKYQIIKLIGQGGMGTVYMAYDIRLDLQVAIKVISPAIAGAGEEPDLPDALKRFEAEAKIAAKIDHPNVVRIFGYHTDSIELDGKAGRLNIS
jgi:eukaryotic-like serine/threonine-protein kinase